jgi:hypothetical protein
MKKIYVWIILVALALTATACGAFGPPNDGIADLPRPGNSSNLTILSEGMLTFDTDMNLKDMDAFYKDMLTKKGYTERKNLSMLTEAELGLVFDGHASGQAIIVQGGLIQDYYTITLRLRDIGKP